MALAAYSPDDIAKVAWRTSPIGYASRLTRKNTGDGRIRPYPHSAYISNAIQYAVAGGHDRIVISVPPQHGKALEVSTPIPTPTGWKAIGDLVPGDQVYGRDGWPCTVLAVSPVWRDRPVYRVRTDDGDDLIADAEHEWEARLCGKTPSFKIHTTAVLARKRVKRAMIRATAPLQAPHQDLPVDPWLLGYWLGDGHSAWAAITVGHQDGLWVRDQVRSLGHEIRQHLAPMVFGVAGLQKPLRALGLINNKHVPTRYLRASEAQRRSLLQGLIDSDGHVHPDGQVEFTTTKRRLADEVRELVWSLGVKAGLAEGRATINGRDCGPKYRLTFYMAGAARLPRKAVRCRDGVKHPGRYVSATPEGTADTVCIEVDSPDHMFLVGRSMLPTHNSTISSLWFPVWFLDLFPDKRIGLASYEATFASEWGWKVRETIKEHPNELRVRLQPDFQARSHWFTTDAGGMFTAGIGGAFTGRGFHVVIFDDPFKNWQEAHSETTRKAVWNFFLSVAYTRLRENAIIVVIQTRWHEDDLIGRLERAELEGGDKWLKVRLPALAEPNDPLGRPEGAALFPQFLNEEALQRRQRVLGSYLFNGMYQQSPAPPEGTIFRRRWWKRYAIMPSPHRFESIIQSWDMSFKDTSQSDWVVCAVWGRIEGDFYLLDLVRDRMDFPTTIQTFKDVSRRWPQAHLKLVEDAANGPAVIASLARQIPGIVAITPEGSKEARAHAVTPIIESGNTWLPEAAIAPWIGEFIEEHATFPNAAHDDQVDTTTQALLRFLGGGAGSDDQWRDDRLAGRR